jgi:hypothetical protein
VRREHAARHPGGAAFVGAVHAHSPAIQRGATRDAEADDTSADDGK